MQAFVVSRVVAHDDSGEQINPPFRAFPSLDVINQYATVSVRSWPVPLASLHYRSPQRSWCTKSASGLRACSG